MTPTRFTTIGDYARFCLDHLDELEAKEQADDPSAKLVFHALHTATETQAPLAVNIFIEAVERYIDAYHPYMEVGGTS